MSLEVGTKIKGDKVDKIVSALTPMLAAGEEIRAVFWANAIRPTKDAIVITNARLISADSTSVSNPAKGFKDSVLVDEITAFQLGTERGISVTLRIVTRDEGERKYCEVKGGDRDAITRELTKVVGRTSAATEGLAAANADAAEADTELSSRIFGGRLSRAALKEILASCRRDERPEFIIAGGMSGALAVFGDRCMIVKKGALTSMMTGSLGGGRVTSFNYTDITGVEYNSGLINGVLEILTPSYQGTANNDFWNVGKKGKTSTDPYMLSNTLPLDRTTHSQVRPHIDKLRDLIAAAKRPAVPPHPPVAASDVSGEISKLVDLHRQGLLDDDEFRMAKKKLFGA